MAYELTYSLINNNASYAVSGYTGEPVNVVIPNTYNNLPVTSISGSAFSQCNSLTSVTIPNSVTSIGDGAFHGCDNLMSVEIPNSVTSIGDGMFSGCDSLTSVVIPDSVTSIGNMSFNYCINLTSVVIPNSVTTIGDLAFRYCSSLTSITIPDSVTSIGREAFVNCENLNSIILFAKTPATIDLDVFKEISAEAKFYCFSSAIDSYKIATNWNTFADKFIADDLKLYFIMSARAQKKYFASKEWVLAHVQNELTYATNAEILALWA